MFRISASMITIPYPLRLPGIAVMGVLTYLGGLGVLLGSAARALVWPRGPAPPLGPAVLRRLDELFGMGLPLVALMHVGLGSFLTMQAFFGATFLEAAGPVVAIGLIRNVAPLLTGLTMAGLLAARIVPELRAGSHAGLDDDPDWVADREVALGHEADPRIAPEPARLAAVRMLAAMMAGPVLVLWATIVGIAIGCLVAMTLLGVDYAIFFNKALDMLWVRDVVGVVVKGVFFALTGAAIACHEGLRPGQTDARTVRMAAFRSVCLASVLILLMNNAWFLLVYHAGPPFGPTVMATPGR